MAAAATPVITCPSCSKKFKGKSDLSGKRIRCPFCEEPFVVPASAAAAKQAVKAAKGEKKTAAPIGFKPDDDEEFGPASNPYGMTKLDLTPRCPHCANEMLSEDAVVCVYCGYNTLTRTWGKTKKVIAHTAGEHFAHLLPGILYASAILTAIILVIFLSVALPGMVQGGHLEWLDHESVRLWICIIVLFGIYPLGLLAYRRLVLEPMPPEKVKD